MNPLLCSLPAATFAVIFAVQAFGFGTQLDSQESREAYFLGRRSDQKTVPFWCLLAIFTGANVIAFWVFAFKPWPTDAKSSNAKY
jgi:hypothetical protein